MLRCNFYSVPQQHAVLVNKIVMLFKFVVQNEDYANFKLIIKASEEFFKFPREIYQETDRIHRMGPTKNAKLSTEEGALQTQTIL